MANLSRPIVLSESDRLELERLQRSPSAPAGLTRRARAVLLMADDVPGAESARQLGYTPVQVSRIRRRFPEAGVAGLQAAAIGVAADRDRADDGADRGADVEAAATIDDAANALADLVTIEVQVDWVPGSGALTVPVNPFIWITYYNDCAPGDPHVSGSTMAETARDGFSNL